MSGLSLLKLGKEGSQKISVFQSSKSSKGLSYKSSINYDNFEVDADMVDPSGTKKDENDDDRDIGFDDEPESEPGSKIPSPKWTVSPLPLLTVPIDVKGVAPPSSKIKQSSLSMEADNNISSRNNQMDELVPLADRIKPTMKLLKHACRDFSDTNGIYEAVCAVQQLASTTYSVRSKLGEKGAGEALLLLLDKCRENADLVSEICKALTNLMVCDEANKKNIGRNGGCRLTVKMMEIHEEDPSVLESCCKLIVELGNAKFPTMLQAELDKEEEAKFLRSQSKKQLLRTPPLRNRSRNRSRGGGGDTVTTNSVEGLSLDEESNSTFKIEGQTMDGWRDTAASIASNNDTVATATTAEKAKEKTLQNNNDINTNNDNDSGAAVPNMVTTTVDIADRARQQVAEAALNPTTTTVPLLPALVNGSTCDNGGTATSGILQGIATISTATATATSAEQGGLPELVEKAPQAQTGTAAAASIVLVIDKQEEEDERHRGEEKKDKIVLEQGDIWDNRLELCRVGATEALLEILRNLVKKPNVVDASVVSLPSIFEDEETVVAACHAIASLTYHPACAATFALDGRVSMYLSALLVHFKHWNLMMAAAWAVINLCQDNVSGNRAMLGDNYIGEALCKGLTELCSRHSEYAARGEEFQDLMDHYVWALLNVVLSNSKNQHRVRMLHRGDIFTELRYASWVSERVRDRMRHLLPLVHEEDAVLSSAEPSRPTTAAVDAEVTVPVTVNEDESGTYSEAADISTSSESIRQKANS